MAIDRREIEQIAHLARLHLKPDEQASIGRDLESILTHIRELETVDISGVPSMVSASEHTAPMRADLVAPDTLHLPIEKVAPAFEEGFFVVPRLAALDADVITEGDSA